MAMNIATSQCSVREIDPHCEVLFFSMSVSVTVHISYKLISAGQHATSPDHVISG